MSGRGRHQAWADDTTGLDDTIGLDDTDASVYNEATRSYNTPPDAGWNERLEVERGSARFRLDKEHGFHNYIVRAPSCRLCEECLASRPLQLSFGVNMLSQRQCIGKWTQTHLFTKRAPKQHV